MKRRGLLWAVLAVVVVFGGVGRGGSAAKKLGVEAVLTGSTIRVSVASDGTEGNERSRYPAISADGRYVAFYSEASNLVYDDTNEYADTFVHDSHTGQTTRVSISTQGVEGNGPSENISHHPSISADGRYVAFDSDASNLVPGDTNGKRDVFVHDREAGTTTRVSVVSGSMESDGSSANPSISADGRYVAFNSNATDLVPGYTNPGTQIYLHDRQTGQTTIVSVSSEGDEGNSPSDIPSISADGRFVAFQSRATNLVPGDTNGHGDVFVRDILTGQTTRVSVASDGTQGNLISGNPSISADGRYVAFESNTTTLIPGILDHSYRIYLHDRVTEETTLVSIETDGSPADGSEYPSISSDGFYIAFHSHSNKLVPGDTNGQPDVFVYDRHAGTTTRISVSSDGTEGNLDSVTPSISGNGRFAAFMSLANNLIPDDTNLALDIYLVTNGEEPNLVDTDRDGLYDEWEIHGIDVDGDGTIDIDLPAMGADPNKKDIFIEVDWMEDEEHSHKPDPIAIKKIVDSFANSPVDGIGINLHVDVGPESIDYVTGKAWGELSGGNSIPHQDVLGDKQDLATDHNNIIVENFSSDRNQVFHYSIFAHKWAKNGITTCSAGFSYGNFTQYFVVALGCYDNGIGSINRQAGTFMHELGHNLGLRHGGDDEINHKPNYLSVMNYSFQMGGLIINRRDGHFDYSRFNLPDLDESQLSETKGLNAGSEIDKYGTKFYVNAFPGILNCIPVYTTEFKFVATATANGPLDWDCNGDINSNPIHMDTNNDGQISVLRSFNDWSNLDFTAGNIGFAAGSQLIEITPEILEQIHEEITPEEDALIQRMPILIFLPITINTSK
jgi:Tol biopolymer transport system component